MSFGHLLKQPCGCGDDRCKAFGAIKPDGHSKGCWDGCEACAKPKKPKRHTIPQPVRRKVMARAKGSCEARIPGVCSGSPDHLHHVRRRSQGGPDTVSNLKMCCWSCHERIHANPEWARANGLLAPNREPLSSAVTKVEKC